MVILGYHLQMAFSYVSYEDHFIAYRPAERTVNATHLLKLGNNSRNKLVTFFKAKPNINQQRHTPGAPVSIWKLYLLRRRFDSLHIFLTEDGTYLIFALSEDSAWAYFFLALFMAHYASKKGRAICCKTKSWICRPTSHCYARDCIQSGRAESHARLVRDEPWGKRVIAVASGNFNLQDAYERIFCFSIIECTSWNSVHFIDSWISSSLVNNYSHVNLNVVCNQPVESNIISSAPVCPWSS